MLSSHDDTACGVDEEAASDTFFESKNSPRSSPSSTSGHLHPYTTPMQFPIDQDPRGQAESCSDRLTWKPSQIPLSLVSGSNGVDESCTTQQSVSNEQHDKTEGVGYSWLRRDNCAQLVITADPDCYWTLRLLNVTTGQELSDTGSFRFQHLASSRRGIIRHY